MESLWRRIWILLAAVTMARAEIRWNSKILGNRRARRHSQACPVSEDGRRGSLCPLAASTGGVVCIEDRQLCDGSWDCPDREDEEPVMCLFYASIRRELHEIIKPRRSSHPTPLHDIASRLGVMNELVGAINMLNRKLPQQPTAPCDKTTKVRENSTKTPPTTAATTTTSTDIGTTETTTFTTEYDHI